MTLSQDEERRLRAIEEALVQEDPTFTKSLTQNRFRRGPAVLACFFGGMALLLAGAVGSPLFLAAGILMATAGYIVMVGSVAQWFRRGRSDLTGRAQPTACLQRDPTWARPLVGRLLLVRWIDWISRTLKVLAVPEDVGS